MAELLDVTQMIAPAMQNKTQNKFHVEWEGLDAFTVKSFQRPTINSGEVVIDYLNTKRYFKGKTEFQPVTLVLNDYIDPSSAQKMMEWLRLCYEFISGREGYKDLYVARGLKLKVLDPPGAVIEEWDFINAFPTSVDFGPLDYASAETLNITVSLRYDGVILNY
jgi:hypothetical protein